MLLDLEVRIGVVAEQLRPALLVRLLLHRRELIVRVVIRPCEPVQRDRVLALSGRRSCTARALRRAAAPGGDRSEGTDCPEPQRTTAAHAFCEQTLVNFRHEPPPPFD